MSPRRRSRNSGCLGRLAVAAVLLLAALFAWAAADVARLDVASLARENPERTSLMRQREREAAAKGVRYAIRHRWVPYESISPHLRRAVLIAEDDAFFSHDGLDWNEIKASARKDLQTGRIARGGSTITQQLAKNLWLGTERTPLRKFKELLLALRLERELSKRRIFELYLNSIEWGDGVFGAEAAARRWYGTSASQLSARQSVRLAAVIINPRRYSPVEPPRRIERRVRMIASRMKRRGELSEAGWREVLGLPEPEPVEVAPMPAESTSGAAESTATPE
ncbi:MAG: monofunctional biosynthetic peptidoglycan transglycosylase [Candidatus Eisenbacteria bacterium]